MGPYPDMLDILKTLGIYLVWFIWYIQEPSEKFGKKYLDWMNPLSVAFKVQLVQRATHGVDHLLSS